MAFKENGHIYIGLGTMVLLLGGALLAYKFSKSHSASSVYRRKGIAVNLSVFDSPDAPGS